MNIKGKKEFSFNIKYMNKFIFPNFHSVPIDSYNQNPLVKNIACLIKI